VLIASRADVDAKTFAGGATPLQRAAFCGHVDVASLLLRHKANPAAVDSDGQTALHKAAEGGHAAVAAVLASSMDTPARSLVDRRGKTAHDIAAQRHSNNGALHIATRPSSADAAGQSGARAVEPRK
jgi:ankyrin repeat protein